MMFLLAHELVSGQVQPDVKAKPDTSGTTKSDGQTNAPSPNVPESQDSQQNNWGLLPPGADPENHLFMPFAKHLTQDQKQFWTYPVHARRDDAKYVLPFLAFTGALMASDSWMTKQVPASPSQLKHSLDFSNYALYSLVGGVGATYLWGHITHSDHLSETGFLGAEAAINSTAITYALKGLTQRTRPLDGSGSAGFFQGGLSFPSEHTAIAWSAASVLAHEYPGTLTKLFAYGLASGITISRVTAKQHFASDVVVGGALGWYMGRQVYRAHHNPELGGTAWGSSAPSPSEGHSTSWKGSPSVPLDSWIYPAFERLVAWGYVRTGMLGMRPWTRSECARLLEEASASLSSDDPQSEHAKVYSSLQKEFAPEMDGSNTSANFRMHLESLYTHVRDISGPPVTNSYNLGSTIINDGGRPFQEGVNVYSGFSGEGTAGPFAFHVQAEYQHAPSAPALPLQAQQAIADQLEVPFTPQIQIAEVNRARIVEGYVSLGFHGVQFSFGKQSLWWGPSETGPLIWSTNAEAIPMFRFSNTRPFKLPSILGWFGPMRTELFLGQLDGQRYIVTNNGVIGPSTISPQPFVHGAKWSFKPTDNLEFGFSRTVIFAGQGHPFTFASLRKSFFSFNNNGGNDNPNNDAGDRRAGFDFSYRVPGLRKVLTLYTDSFCEDDVSPLEYPQRCAWNPGVYLSHIPHWSKLDFRAEGVNTDVSGFKGTGINYWNFIYPSGYTNNGNIVGNWVGRAGRGLQMWSTFWYGPQSKIQAGYRHQGVDRDFLKGGWLDDLSVKTEWMLRSELVFSGAVQYEKWNFPLLAANTKSNVSVSLGLTFRPSWSMKH
jgi:hypothetical protein